MQFSILNSNICLSDNNRNFHTENAWKNNNTRSRNICASLVIFSKRPRFRLQLKAFREHAFFRNGKQLETIAEKQKKIATIDCFHIGKLWIVKKIFTTISEDNIENFLYFFIRLIRNDSIKRFDMFDPRFVHFHWTVLWLEIL